jgi:transaldolase / glucose-6-phosphate isomerase
MDPATQEVVAGQLQFAFATQISDFREKQLVRRFWDKDPTIWPSEHTGQGSIHSNLSWLDFPDTLEPLFRAISNVAEASIPDGLSDWVFLALGSSSFAARSLLPLLSQPSHHRFFILDSCHPAAIRRLENTVDVSHTGFVLANKAGDRLEDQALFLHFQHKLQLIRFADANRHFIAQTEANSYLDMLSRSYPFRASFLDPPNTLSSYCSLLHFGALLTAFSILSIDQILSAARSMRQLCSVDPPLNPALQLAAFLVAAALSHSRYLVFLSSCSLAPYSCRLENLIGSCFPEEGPGLLPVCGNVPRLTQSFQKDACFIFLTLEGEPAPDLYEKIEVFRKSAIPFVHIHMPELSAVLQETFKFEIATALACANLGVNPFAWPDDRYARKTAMELLDSLASAPEALTRTPRIQESGVQLFAEGRTRSEISTFSLTEAFRSFFRLTQPHSALVLFVFLDRTPESESMLSKIRELLTRQLGVPVFLSYGPRGFDNYPYLFRSNLSDSLSIVLTGNYPLDIPVPGASYTFAQLHAALCLGEFESLNHSDRLVIRVNLTGEQAESLVNLELAVGKALSRSL